MPLTRRKLIGAMARLGGAGAAYETLTALGFLQPPIARAALLDLPPDSGTGKTVVVLGAGVSGMCAAYELDRAGYDVIVLEATRRIGGRSLTLRRGDRFAEVRGPVQECEFDEGLWLNAGPGRIPHHHVHLIEYCRKFGVALQPYIFVSRANLFHSGSGPAGAGTTMQLRRSFYDLQGEVAELLDKCIVKGGLDLPVTGADVQKLRDMLEQFGALTRMENGGKVTYSYTNKFGHSGYKDPPGLYDQPGKPLSPLALDEILRSDAWKYIFREASYSWQTSLLEPVGGMDNFVKGFARQPLSRQAGTIEGLVRFGAEVIEIDFAYKPDAKPEDKTDDKAADKVVVAYRDASGPRTVMADYCVCTIPMPIFKGLKVNLSKAYMDAAAALPIQPAGKVGFQAPRFWETKDEIYGGISWTTDDITQIWYPSSGFLSPKGVLTGAYMYGDTAQAFNARPIADRLRLAKEQGEKLHPGYANLVERGLAIGWNNMEFEQFGWADESNEKTFGPNARVLAQPQKGRFHMAGDQITYWSGWQEGALISAIAAVGWIHSREHPNATRRG